MVKGYHVFVVLSFTFEYFAYGINGIDATSL